MQRRTFLKTTAAGALVPLVVSPALAQTSVPKNPKVDEIRSRIKPITPEERQQRIDKAQKIMQEQNIDAVFFEGGTSLNYFTGIRWDRSERLFAMILFQNGAPVFIAPEFEHMRAAEQAGSSKLFTWQEDEDPYAVVKTILTQFKCLTGVIGIEETTRDFVTGGIKRKCGGADLISGTIITAGCRSVKSDHEIELIQIGNDITKEVYLSAVEHLKDGMTEREYGAIITKLYAEFGVSGGALVLFGEASASPHGFQKQQTLKENQIVLMDGGCTVEGYQSDVTRTTVFGKSSDDMQKVFNIVLKAQSRALAVAKPGIAAEEIDLIARIEINTDGFGPGFKYFTHRLGHGIGMDEHEWYYLVPGNKRQVEPRNTFSNEPGIYQPGKFGIRIEDEMLITDDGAKLLLPKPKSLEIMF